MVFTEVCKLRRHVLVGEWPRRPPAEQWSCWGKGPPRLRILANGESQSLIIQWLQETVRNTTTLVAFVCLVWIHPYNSAIAHHTRLTNDERKWNELNLKDIYSLVCLLYPSHQDRWVSASWLSAQTIVTVCYVWLIGEPNHFLSWGW